MTADIQIIRLHQEKADEIRENSLNHLRVSYMTEMVQTANGTGADLKNLGQGSNKRALRRPDRNGNDVARYKDTTASANQHFLMEHQDHVGRLEEERACRSRDG